jgi:hypothetical protein
MRRIRLALPINHLLVQLTPLVFIAFAFYFSSDRLKLVSIGRIPLFELLLAGAITLPVFSRIACTPLHLDIAGDAIQARSDARAEIISGKIAQKLPQSLLLVALVVALTGWLMALRFHWSPTAMTAFMLFSLIETFFAQMMVYASLRHATLIWLSAWAIHAAIITISPAHYALGPLTASAFIILALAGRKLTRIHKMKMFAFNRVALAHSLLAVFPGLLFWGDKLLLAIERQGTSGLEVIFLGIVPSILLSHLYFSHFAPPIHSALTAINDSMHRDSLSSFQHAKTENIEKVRLMLRRLFVAFAVIMSVSIPLLAAFAGTADTRLLLIATSSLFECLNTQLVGLHQSAGSRSLALGTAVLHIVILAFLHFAGASMNMILSTQCLFHFVAACALTQAFMKRWMNVEYHTVWKRLLVG